jgi:YhcH/YjgK/YiaL family protein
VVIDTLESAEKYECLHPGLAAAFAWLRETDLSSLEPGKPEIAGRKLWANIIAAPAKAEEDCRLEVHRDYLDIQVLVRGSESIGWKPTAACESPAGEFDAEKDVGFFQDEPTGWYAVPEGGFALFFPEDAHAPMCGNGDLFKVVVKVAVEW